MSDLSVNRTLVKSPPELWSEVSEVESLARHLGEFGQIRITRLDPEHTVAWEGESARGTVELEVSGWGTKVTLSAAVTAPAEPAPADEPDPEAVLENEARTVTAPAPARSPWFRRFLRREAVVVKTAPPEPEPAVVEPEPVAVATEPVAPTAENSEPSAEAVLEAALDNLGAAHHRPFSREG